MLPTRRPCEWCLQPIPVGARTVARFCSTKCRVANHRAKAARVETIPAELRAHDRWVRYSSRKVPLQTTGSVASSTDASTWTTYADASTSHVGEGVGYVLGTESVVCLDLDHCLQDGVPTPAARRFLRRLPATYVEVSRSGEGLHVFGYGVLRGAGRKLQRDGLSIEVYARGRYIAVTGNTYGDPSGLADLQEVLADLL